jgi:peptidoglycan biosynthesis protein MviN/MurJ (putative lipid II flippase)
MTSLLLAHGGTAGLVFEAAFLVVPVVVFGILALITRRRRDDQIEDQDEDELGW